MPGDLVSLGQQFLGEGGFITFLNTPAGEPLRRIFSAGGKFVASHIDAETSKRETKTAGEATVNRAVAEAGAQQLAENPDLVRRAGERLLSKELRAQENLEAIGLLTWDELKDDSSAKASSGPSADFTNQFEELASNASSEDLRRMFARVLAGEIRSPGSISLSTLRFASVIDTPLARLIQGFVDDLFEDKVFAVGKYKSGAGLLDLREMESHNLLYTGVNVGGSGDKVISVQGDSVIITEGGAIQVAIITRMGREVFSLFSSVYIKNKTIQIGREIKADNPNVNVSIADILSRSGSSIRHTIPTVIT